MPSSITMHHVACRLLLVLLICLAPLSQCVTLEFPVGTAQSLDGAYSEMTWAHRGYELFAQKVNDMGGFPVGTTGTKVTFRLFSENDHSDPSSHHTLVQRFISQDHVRAVMGGGPAFANNETAQCAGQGVLNIQCCVGPDPVYQQGFREVFGTQCSNTKYPESFIRRVNTLGVKSVCIVYVQDNIFTETTCASAKALAESEGMTVSCYRPYPTAFSAADIESVAHEAAQSEAEALIGCSLFNDGVALTRALNAIPYFFKAMFMTIGRSDPRFVTELGQESSYLCSAGQWYPGMRFEDESFFGSPANYVSQFQAVYHDKPTYVAAGASASLYVLMRGLQEAYWRLPSPNSTEDIDTGLVIEAMKKIQLKTFFGVVDFNKWNRNAGKVPATTQILPKGTGNSLIQRVVLPVENSNDEFIFPIPGSVYPKWSSITGQIFLALSIINTCLLATILALVLHFRRVPVMRKASRGFSVTIIGSALGGSCLAYLLFGIPTPFVCSARVALGGLGYSLLFGALLAKVWRVALIFRSAAHLELSVLHTQTIVSFSLSFALFDVLVLCVWFGAFPLRTERASCTGDHYGLFLGIFLISKALVLLIAVVIAFLARNVSDEYNECRAIVLSVYNIALCSAVLIPIILVNNTDPSYTASLTCVASYLIATGTIAIIFVPKIRMAMQTQYGWCLDTTTKAHWRDSTHSTAENYLSRTTTTTTACVHSSAVAPAPASPGKGSTITSATTSVRARAASLSRGHEGSITSVSTPGSRHGSKATLINVCASKLPLLERIKQDVDTLRIMAHGKGYGLDEEERKRMERASKKGKQPDQDKDKDKEKEKEKNKDKEKDPDALAANILRTAQQLAGADSLVPPAQAQRTQSFSLSVHEASASAPGPSEPPALVV